MVPKVEKADIESLLPRVGRLLLNQLARLQIRAVELIQDGRTDRAVEELQEGFSLMTELVHGGAGFHAIAAENAAVVVDVIDLGVALAAADAHLIGVFGGFDIDAVGRAGRRAQETGDALLQAVLVALQHVDAAIALLQVSAARPDSSPSRWETSSPSR